MAVNEIRNRNFLHKLLFPVWNPEGVFISSETKTP